MTLKSPTIMTFINAFWLFALGYVLTYMFNALVASSVPPAVYGDFSLAIYFLKLTVPFYILGTNTTILKYLPQYLAQHDKTTLRYHLRWNLNTVILAILMAFIVLSIAVLTLFLLDYAHISALNNYHLAVFFQLIAPLVGLALLIGNILLAMKRVLLANVLQTIVKWGFYILLFALFTFMFGRENISSHALFWIIFLGSLAWMATSILSLLHNIDYNPKRFLSNKLPTNLALAKEWSRYSKLLLFNSSIYTFTAFIDLLIIEIIPYRGEHNMGYYAACLTICGLLWVPEKAIAQVLKPFLSAKTTNASHQKLLNKGFLLKSGLLICFTITMVVFAKTFLSHFGPTYVNYADILRLLVIGNMLSLLPSFCIFDALYNGYEHILLYQSYFKLISTALFCALAYYFFGLIGIAWTVVLIRCLSNYGFFIYVKTRAKLNYMLFI